MMISNLRIYRTENTQAARNLAMERLLRERLVYGEAILLVCTQEPSLTLGRNEELSAVCDAAAAGKAGLKILRRVTGGDTEYMDPGCARFSMMSAMEDLPLEVFTAILTRTFEILKLNVTVTDRALYFENKLCGTLVTYENNGGMLTHGAVYLDANLEQRTAYLKNAAEAVNLNVSRAAFEGALMRAFAEAYHTNPGAPVEYQPPKRPLQEMTTFFKSSSWLHGNDTDGEWIQEGTYPWGTIRYRFHLEGSILRDGAIYSNAMDAELIASLMNKLYGADLSAPKLKERFTPLSETKEKAQILADACMVLLKGAAEVMGSVPPPEDQKIQ